MLETAGHGEAAKGGPRIEEENRRRRRRAEFFVLEVFAKSFFVSYTFEQLAAITGGVDALIVGFFVVILVPFDGIQGNADAVKSFVRVVDADGGQKGLGTAQASVEIVMPNSTVSMITEFGTASLYLG